MHITEYIQKSLQRPFAIASPRISAAQTDLCLRSSCPVWAPRPTWSDCLDWTNTVRIIDKERWGILLLPLFTVKSLTLSSFSDAGALLTTGVLTHLCWRVIELILSTVCGLQLHYLTSHYRTKFCELHYLPIARAALCRGHTWNAKRLAFHFLYMVKAPSH